MTFLNQLKMIVFVMLLICLDKTYAQKTINVTGGNVSGVNGSVVYSVGQLLYTTYTGNNGSVSEGVQHPKESLITLGIDENSQNLSQLTVYPNPTMDFIKLNINNINWQDLQYQVFDINGRNVLSENFKSENALINLKKLKPSIYFLKISDHYKNLRSFKIIKTN